MTARLAQLACLFLLMGCASKRPTDISGSVEVAPDTSAVLHLVGQEHVAQACPIGPERALTNAHVVKGARPDEQWKPYSWHTSQGLGLAGAVRVARWRDLAEVIPTGGTFPRWYPVAATPPLPGERVWFVGYDWRDRPRAFTPRIFPAIVERVEGPLLILFPAGTPGSSGSCVLNTRGEVVAINAAGKDIEDGTVVGVAVGVWAGLLDLGK